MRQSRNIIESLSHCESKKLDPFSFEHNFGQYMYCPILIIISLLQTEINYDNVP